MSRVLFLGFVVSRVGLSRVCHITEEIEREREGERERERENFTKFNIAILISRVMFYIDFV